MHDLDLKATARLDNCVAKTELTEFRHMANRALGNFSHTLGRLEDNFNALTATPKRTPDPTLEEGSQSSNGTFGLSITPESKSLKLPSHDVTSGFRPLRADQDRSELDAYRRETRLLRSIEQVELTTKDTDARVSELRGEFEDRMGVLEGSNETSIQSLRDDVASTMYMCTARIPTDYAKKSLLNDSVSNLNGKIDGINDTMKLHRNDAVDRLDSLDRAMTCETERGDQHVEMIQRLEDANKQAL